MSDATKANWRESWRRGVAPAISTPGLRALRAGLVADDARLLQGATTSPPPLMAVQDWPCEGACGIGFAAWQGDGAATVDEVEQAFAKCCFDADAAMGEPAACRWFLNWFDDTPRDEMRRELTAEIDVELRRRGVLESPEVPAVIGGAA